MQIHGSTCLVTGASSGIGRAVASTLAERGARLLLTGRDADRLAEVRAETRGATLTADLGDADAVERLADWALAVGPPQVVIHCAGAGMVTTADEVSPDQLQRLLSVNLLAPILLTQRLIPAMDDQPGRLVFVTSIAGLLGAPREAIYAASKAALHGYADSLRPQLAPRGIGVTTFAPGVVATEFFTRRGAPYDRRVPRPMPVERVARELADAIERDRDVVVLPRWLRVPVALHAVAPSLYNRLANRWS